MLWIFIIALAILFICAMIVGVLLEKKHIKELKEKDDKNNYLQRENDYLNEKIAELNLKFSGSLDTREKNYNDIFIQYKKTQLDLDAALQEIDRLKDTNRVLAKAINEGMKGDKDEKEEA